MVTESQNANETPTPEEKDGNEVLSKNTKITIGSAIGILIVIIGFVNKEASFKINTTRDIQKLSEEVVELKKDIEELEKEKIKKIEIERWLFHLQKNNPELDVPDF